MFGGHGRTDCDGVHFPVKSGWNGRMSVWLVCEIVSKSLFYNVTGHLVCWFLVLYVEFLNLFQSWYKCD